MADPDSSQMVLKNTSHVSGTSPIVNNSLAEHSPKHMNHSADVPLLEPEVNGVNSNNSIENSLNSVTDLLLNNNSGIKKTNNSSNDNLLSSGRTKKVPGNSGEININTSVNSFKTPVKSSCSSQVSPQGKHNAITNSPSKSRLKPLTSGIVTNKDLAEKLLQRSEKKQQSYPDRMDVLLAAMQPESPVKPLRKEECKLDACELLSILQDGAEVHYVEKPKPKPRVPKNAFRDIKLDPELEKRLALKQLMEFSRKRGRPRKSETEHNNNNSNSNNNNNNNNNNSSSSTKVSNDPQPPQKTSSSESSSPKKIKRTPNRELNRLLQDEGAINMLYSIEKGGNETKDKLLPSKRRMKKALMKKAQEVTEALLGGTTSSGLSLRHRSTEKRKPSTESLDSEHSEFHFTTPSDSRIIRRHSSSSSYSSSRASSPCMASPGKQEDGIRISEKTELLIEAKCKELNLQPEHSQIIKKLIQEKHNGFKERLQTEFASKLRAAISRGNQEKGISGSSTLTASPSEVWKMVEEDWGSGSDSEPETVEERSKAPVTDDIMKVENVKEERKEEIINTSPIKDKEGKSFPVEITTYREVTVEFIEGLAYISLEAHSSALPHALSPKVLRELSQVLEYVSQSLETKAIALCSSGRDFCLGLDLPGLLTDDINDRRSLAATAALAIKEFACKVCMLGKPLLAGVRGRAVGLGAVLLAYCDMVLAEPCSSFMAPYPKLACFPEAAATTLLPHVIGLAHSKKLLVSCAKLNSAEAEACGLVTQIIPEGLLKEKLISAGRDFMAQSQQIVASTKAVLMHGLRTKIPSVLNTEVKLLQQHWITDDCQRRIRDLEQNPLF